MSGGASQSDHNASDGFCDIGGGVKLYSRKSWAAREPKQFQAFPKPASFFFIHHTDGNTCHDFETCVTTLKGIQNYHMDTKGSDAPCHNIGGTCQDDHLHCTGSYLTGLCSGATHRRCCSSSTSQGGVDIGGCSNVKIYSRDSWGARPPKSFSTFHTPARLFFIHHTAGHTCHDFNSCAQALRGIQNYHMDTKGWSDIGYSFLVGQDGNIYEGRGWHHVGAHTQGYNSRGFAASFMGNYMTHLPNAASLTAVKHLIACGIQKGYIAHDYHLYGHRDVGSTECPGDRLYQEIQSWPHYSHTHP